MIQTYGEAASSHHALMRLTLLLLSLAAMLSGCGLVAAPCRVGSAALDIVPVVGHAAATPTNACADTIDP